VRVAQLHEARRLVGGKGVDRATQVQRVVGQDADRAAFDARQRGVDADAETAAQGQHTAHVKDASDGGACVIDSHAILRHHALQRQRVGRLPLSEAALKERQVMPRRRYRFRFVSDQNINHAIAVLHAAGANLLWREHSQAAALDHGRATMPMCCFGWR